MKISFCPSGLLFMAFPLLLLKWKRPENRMRTGCFRVIPWVIPHSLEHSNCPINICQRNEWRNERMNNWVSKLLKHLDEDGVVALYYSCWLSTQPLSFGPFAFPLDADPAGGPFPLQQTWHLQPLLCVLNLLLHCKSPRSVPPHPSPFLYAGTGAARWQAQEVAPRKSGDRCSASQMLQVWGIPTGDEMGSERMVLAICFQAGVTQVHEDGTCSVHYDCPMCTFDS